MSRHQHDTDVDLDPAIAAELDQLEAALAGDLSADPGLLALVGRVREDAVPPSLAFRTSLDERVAAGFPKPGGNPFTAFFPWIWRHRVVAGPATAVAAAALIALVVATGSTTTTTSDDGSFAAFSGRATTASGGSAASSGTATTESAAPQSDALAAPAAKQAAPVTPPSASSASSAAGTVAAPSPSTPRKVERTTRLSLRTNAARLQTVADGVVRVTQSSGGVVQTSNVDATDRGGTADFTLSVPTAQADDVVARLSKLAHVASMSQASTDITNAFVSSADQLTDARAERRALLKALDGAQTADGIARLKSRIAANRNEIARLKSSREQLRHRADETTLSVTVSAHGAPAKPSGDDKGTAGGGWSPGDAAGDALRVLEIAAGVLLIALAVLVPFGVIGLPALFGARFARRRRREQALDAA